jgi:hypothetical protein
MKQLEVIFKTCITNDDLQIIASLFKSDFGFTSQTFQGEPI